MLPEPTADRLAVAPATGRHPARSAIYRVARMAGRVVGTRAVLGVLANLARFFHRLAFEWSVAVFGESFANSTMPLDDALLDEIIGPETTVVDLGCGVGRYTRRVAPRAKLVVGIDYDRAKIDLARRQTDAPNVEFHQGDVRELDRVFDVGILVHVLEHIDDPVGFLKSLHGNVRRLAVEVPDFDSDPVNLARLALGRPFSSESDHVREYTEATLRATLAEGGWTVQEVRKRGGAIAAVAG